ncbi:hypothetical protein J3B02_001533 [Coemansia erecta]|uniref:Uncharacterized protein n=1 Tax=Coemansia asiatica TaxID=1052880 RepID=A0A9W8CGK2_9FUNG|nr:hypothetical protein LPJ64_005860 [Coemansia asiatica]KAJ2856558.1 hypothetical protein J3B02_001533 [Coemansia erecta]
MSKLAAKLLEKGGLPPTAQFASKPKTLYELLNVQRFNAHKLKVTTEHWYQKGFENCYYEVHRVKYKQYRDEPTHGKAWGILYWNGKPVSEKPREIRGGLKFSWRRYESPHDNGIYYDAEKAMNLERRRTRLVREYIEKEKAGMN